MSMVTFGCSASNSAATSSHSERPGSLFWMCHQSMVTASPEPDSPPDDSASEASSSSPPHDAATSATTPTSSALRANLRRMIVPLVQTVSPCAAERRAAPSGLSIVIDNVIDIVLDAWLCSPGATSDDRGCGGRGRGLDRNRLEGDQRSLRRRARDAGEGAGRRGPARLPDRAGGAPPRHPPHPSSRHPGG